VDKFEIRGPCLILQEPLSLDERGTEEEAFLSAVDRLLDHKVAAVTIDAVRAGNLSSTLIALIIAASRKAEAAKKKLHLRTSKRNAIAVRISGLERLAQVELV
jgi:hypothetical protein